MQQSLRQASIRAVTGTTGTYEEDWLALFTRVGVAAGTFNERMLMYINQRLGTAYTEVNGAMAAMAAAESVDNFQALGTFDPWIPYNGAEAHLDFVNQQYYWDGAERADTDFATFTGATFGTGNDAGLIGTGTAADYDISLAWASLNIAAPFVMVTVFRPKLLNASNQIIIRNQAAATPGSNYTQHGITTANVANHITVVGAATQANQVSSALTVDTNYALGTLVQTNLFRNSVNGATAGPEDTSGSLPTHSSILFMESGTGTLPFTGRIRHVLFFAQTGGSEMSQTDLNTLTTALSAI